jgi:hypothetical protein
MSSIGETIDVYKLTYLFMTDVCGKCEKLARKAEDAAMLMRGRLEGMYATLSIVAVLLLAILIAVR